MFKPRLCYTIAGVYLFLFYDFLQLDMMNVVAPFLQTTLHVSKIQLGIIHSLYFYVNFVLLIPAGFFLDRYKPKNLIMISLLFNALSQSVFVFSPSLTSAIAWRAGAGIAGAFSYLSALKVLSDNFDHKNLGVLIGFSGLSIMIAGIISQAPLAYVLLNLGLKETLLINIFLAIVTLLAIAVLLSQSHFNKNHAGFIKNLQVFKKILSSSKTVLTALFAGLINMPLFILGASWGIVYLTSHHFTISQASIATSAIFVGDIIGAPVMGYISDRLLSRVQTMVIGVLGNIAALSLIYILVATNLLILTFLFFLVGFTCTAQTPAYAYVIELNSKKEAAKSSSLVSAVSLGLVAIAEPFIGAISEVSNTYFSIVGTLIITSALTLVLGLLLLRINFY